MGPYCHFCDQRCFVYLTEDVPADILKAYGTSTIIATCPDGQVFEKAKVGYCYADIKAARRQNNIAAFFEAVGMYASEALDRPTPPRFFGDVLAAFDE